MKIIWCTVSGRTHTFFPFYAAITSGKAQGIAYTEGGRKLLLRN